MKMLGPSPVQPSPAIAIGTEPNEAGDYQGPSAQTKRAPQQPSDFMSVLCQLMPTIILQDTLSKEDNNDNNNNKSNNSRLSSRLLNHSTSTSTPPSLCAAATGSCCQSSRCLERVPAWRTAASRPRLCRRRASLTLSLAIPFNKRTNMFLRTRWCPESTMHTQYSLTTKPVRLVLPLPLSLSFSLPTLLKHVFIKHRPGRLTDLIRPFTCVWTPQERCPHSSRQSSAPGPQPG